MKALKGYVRNTMQLDGNMAIGYSIEEALGFCIEYIQGVKSIRRRAWDKEEPTMHDEVLEGSGCPHRLSVDLKTLWAHTFVLHNEQS